MAGESAGLRAFERIKSAGAALALTFCVFALLPLSKSDIFRARKREKDYIPVKLAAKAERPENPEGAAAPLSGGISMPSSAPPRPASAAPFPVPAFPSGYGLAPSGPSGAGDVFSMKAFSAGGLSGPAGDFSMEAFELAELDGVPRRLSSGRSEYPRHLYARGVEGDVRLSLFINPDGTVEVDRVLSSTHRDFEAAAEAAASSQTYEPPTKGGKAVRARFELLIPFRIVK